jgi:hypothetical protein
MKGIADKIDFWVTWIWEVRRGSYNRRSVSEITFQQNWRLIPRTLTMFLLLGCLFSEAAAW